MIAISTGPFTHLDHLAPLCVATDVPLIVTDQDHFALGKQFYPMVDLHYVPLAEMTLERIAHDYSAIVTCGKFWAMELKPLLKMLYQKDLRFIFIPHGYSDKEELLDMPIEQDIHLTYRELGNLRHAFYLEHRSHFDQLAAPYFDTDKKSVLYAPTWETTATTTSFFESTSQVIDGLSDSYNLLIKLHPLLEENDPARFYQIIGKYESKAHFILNFPAVYPLLEKSDIYLGDFSSVGYDYLTYNRPMFFLKKSGKLAECGELYNGSLESNQDHLATIRKKVFAQTFAAVPSCEKIKALISS